MLCNIYMLVLIVLNSVKFTNFPVRGPLLHPVCCELVNSGQNKNKSIINSTKTEKQLLIGLKRVFLIDI